MKRISQYSRLDKTYIEPFFISYAVRGPILNPDGNRAGLPIEGPLRCSPVKEPSPLNTQYVLDAILRQQESEIQEENS